MTQTMMKVSDLMEQYRPANRRERTKWMSEYRALERDEPGYIAELMESIRKHGIQEPVEIHNHMEQRDGTIAKGIYDGHHRVLAAWKLKLEEIPVVDASYNECDYLLW